MTPDCRTCKHCKITDPDSTILDRCTLVDIQCRFERDGIIIRGMGRKYPKCMPKAVNYQARGTE